MANLAQIITLQIFVHTLFFQKKMLKSLIFIVFFANRVFRKTNLAQIITLENPKLGPDNNSTAHIYIYMLWSYYLGQVWGFPKLLSGPSQCYYLGQVCFRTIKIGVSGDFFCSVIILCFFFVSSYLLIF